MQAKLRKLQLEIRKMIKKNYDGETPELIQSDLKKLLKKYQGVTLKQADVFRKSIETRIKNEWVKSKTPQTFAKIDKMLSTDYAIVQGNINSKLVKAVSRGINTGMSIKEMTALIDRKMEMGKHKANTVARTARLAQNRALKLKKAISAGAKKFKYSGPSPERDFCTKHHGETMTIKEILQLDNKQGLPVLVYMGGYNCKH